MCLSRPEGTVCVNKALSWASIKLFQHNAFLSQKLCLMEICFCCRSSMSLLSPDWRREKGRSEWASIVLCSRQFTHTHLPNHTHSLLFYNEINALSFPLCAQHLTVPQASCDQTLHRVLQLLILMLTQCCFCTLVLPFIHTVFRHNKRCYFWWHCYHVFSSGQKIHNHSCLAFFFVCFWSHLSPACCQVTHVYLVLALSFIK